MLGVVSIRLQDLDKNSLYCILAAEPLASCEEGGSKIEIS